MCRKLIILPPDYEEYQYVSGLMKGIISEYSELSESFGLDEQWNCLSNTKGLTGDPVAIAKEIQWRIWDELGITVKIGISFNKITAKLASDMNGPCSITYIPPENYEKMVYPLPVEDLLMVGRKYKQKLNHLCIRTIGDLAGFDRSMLRYKFGVYGEMLSVFARGEDRTPVKQMDHVDDSKSIGNSITTPRDLLTNEDVRLILYKLCESVATRTRDQGFKGRVVKIWVRSSGLFGFSRQRKIGKYTNIAQEISEEAMRLFIKNYFWHEPIRSIGVCLSDFEHENVSTQLNLFENEESRMKRENLERNIDDLRDRYGPFSVQRAIMLTDPHLAGFDPYTMHTVHPIGFFS